MKRPELFLCVDVVHRIRSTTEGFYFLAPMVKDSEYSGIFDGGLSPVVQICELRPVKKFTQALICITGMIWSTQDLMHHRLMMLPWSG